MTNESTPKPEPLKFHEINERAIEADGKVLGIAIERFVEPATAADIRASFAMPAPQQDSGHELLSKFVYDLARRIEAHAMSDVEGDFLEELIAMIARAPLSQEYAVKLAFASPANPARGSGPHKLYHEPSGEWAWCGGPGLCRWCTEGKGNG